ITQSILGHDHGPLCNVPLLDCGGQGVLVRDPLPPAAEEETAEGAGASPWRAARGDGLGLADGETVLDRAVDIGICLGPVRRTRSTAASQRGTGLRQAIGRPRRWRAASLG